MNLLQDYRVVLLDLNNTFMFGADRFGAGEDFAATYRTLGGKVLAAQQIDKVIRACYDRMSRDYEDPARYDEFPPLLDTLRAVASEMPEEELQCLERVFSLHELGRVPDKYADFLRHLAAAHELGLVTNIWSRKDRWVDELTRVGLYPLFKAVVFSSDHQSIKPSPVLFRLALKPFAVAPREALFVGDSLRCDIEGARSVGLKTVWINPSGGRHPSADFVVRDLLDLA